MQKIVTILNSSATSFPNPQQKKNVVITAIVGSPTGPYTYWGGLNTDTTVHGKNRKSILLREIFLEC